MSAFNSPLRTTSFTCWFLFYLAGAPACFDLLLHMICTYYNLIRGKMNAQMFFVQDYNAVNSLE